jgi:pathogenesis-related protein 1
MRKISLLAWFAFITGCGGGDGGGAGAGGTTGNAGTAGAAGTTGAAGSTGAGGTSGGRTNPLSQVQIDAFVTAHNQARSGPLSPTPSPALPPVSWDPILADVAYNYASRCPGSGDLIPHNANRTADYRALGGTDSYVGENIYGTTSTSTVGVAADAMDLWMDEAPLYDYAANNIGDAGHYTQIVWRSSVRIGCAIVDCPNVKFRNTTLCDYAPGGNITNQKPY